MKRVLLFGGAFVTGLAAALLAAAAMVVLPGWVQRGSWQGPRPAGVVPPAAPAAGEEESAPAPTPPPRDFTDLLARNPDVVGWIAIDGTPVDFPVTQTTDNTYYLSHDLDRQYDPEGIPFADYECDAGQGDHLIIYGHNMGKGQTARFSSLQNYRHPDYYTRHPVIQLDTPEGSALYKIAAVYALSARPEDGDYFDFNRHVEFADEADRQRYLDEVAARSFYTAGEPPRPGERLLSLCICTYEMEDARLIVMARPLRPGEDGGPDPVTENPSPACPPAGRPGHDPGFGWRRPWLLPRPGWSFCAKN